MQIHDPDSDGRSLDSRLLLGIDTCGSSGSVALGRLRGSAVEVLEQIELEGRTYSSTLISAIEDLLARHGVELAHISCIVIADGPGSFTGVRVGLSAAKGLAEGAGIPLVTVSRLEVLSRVAATPNAAIDAHRQEIFLRLKEPTSATREMLAASSDLDGLPTPADPVAVCDDPAAMLLRSSWPTAQLIRMPAPTAANALQSAVAGVLSGERADVALVDGRYLRRSDAEIFGDPRSSRSRQA